MKCSCPKTSDFLTNRIFMVGWEITNYEQPLFESGTISYSNFTLYTKNLKLFMIFALETQKYFEIKIILKRVLKKGKASFYASRNFLLKFHEKRAQITLLHNCMWTFSFKSSVFSNKSWLLLFTSIKNMIRITI